MTKFFQNRIAENSLSLLVMSVSTIVVWLLSGLVSHGWWSQFIWFVVSTYLVVELSNSNALLRVRSRMVSCVFLALSCVTSFLFGSISGAITQLCLIAMLLILFRTYQDNCSPGSTFYAFLCLGIGGLAFVQLYCFVPIIWILMRTQLQSLSWRTWIASLLGLCVPYWISLPYFVYHQDFTPVTSHFRQLLQLPFPHDYSTLGIVPVVSFVFVVALSLMGIGHFWLRSYEDKFRIRQLYGFLISLTLLLEVLIILQPQHYEVLMRMLIVTASPLIAHFFTFTHSRLANIFFIAILAMTLLLTVFHLVVPRISPWIGL